MLRKYLLQKREYTLHSTHRLSAQLTCPQSSRIAHAKAESTDIGMTDPIYATHRIFYEAVNKLFSAGL